MWLGGGEFHFTPTPAPSKPHGPYLQSMLPFPPPHPRPLGANRQRLTTVSPDTLALPLPPGCSTPTSSCPPDMPRMVMPLGHYPHCSPFAPPAPLGSFLQPKHHPMSSAVRGLPGALGVSRDMGRRRRGATGHVCGQANLAWTLEVTQQRRPHDPSGPLPSL